MTIRPDISGLHTCHVTAKARQVRRVKLFIFRVSWSRMYRDGVHFLI